MATGLVIGCPAWDRAWALPLWFKSVVANVDPATTGLVFVTPASDQLTRDAILAGVERYGFAWHEILRDKGKQFGRKERIDDAHANLARARNMILQTVEHTQPSYYLSWDSDMLVPEGTVERVKRLRVPLVTVWTWLNRQPPALTEFERQQVYWQPPIRATAMAWDPRQSKRALHYPPKQFNLRASGVWQCGVALAWQLMEQRAYRVASYAPHPDGEDVPFNWMLHQRGILRYCCGDVVGVHLYDRHNADERALGWPRVLTLAEQRPLAAQWTEPRSPEHEALGFFNLKEAPHGSSIKA